MLAYIQGNITQKAPTYVVIESGGIGYWINISLNTFSKIQDKTSCKLHTYLHLGGSLQGPMSVSLFGFYDEAEREVFTELLNISGVGTATVRMILSSLSPEEIQHAIVSENTGLLENIKGIGPKTAKRIVLELKDKMGKKPITSSSISGANNNLKEEALSALVMLGFSRVQAENGIGRVLKENKPSTVEEIIKLALKQI